MVGQISASSELRWLCYIVSVIRAGESGNFF